MTLVLGLCLLLSLLLSFTNIINSKWIYMGILTIILAILGFFFNPMRAYLNNGDYTDLVRIFQELNIFQEYGWNFSNDNNILMTTDYNAVIVSKLYMYVIASITTNFHWLPFINSILSYGFFGIALVLISKKMNIRNSYVSLSFLLFIFINDYSRVIANIRMPLALSLFIFIWACEIYRDKVDILQILGYICVCLIHNAMYILVILKIATIFINKNNQYIIYTIIGVSSLFVNQVIDILYKIKNIGPILAGLLQKMILYSSENGVGIESFTHYKTDIIFDIFRISIMLFLILMIKNNKVIIDEKMNNLVNFGILLAVFALGSIWSFHLFNRIVLSMLLLIPIYTMILSNRLNQRIYSIYKWNTLNIIIWFITIGSILFYFLGHVYQQLTF